MLKSFSDHKVELLTRAAMEFDQALPENRKKVFLDDLWKGLDAIALKTGGIALDQRELLYLVLCILKEKKGYSFPKGEKGYDTFIEPYLPIWILRPLPRKPQRPKVDLWVPELAALASQHGLKPYWGQVNEWLKKTRNCDLDSIPVKERSFEIFGNEKLLETILASTIIKRGIVSEDIFCSYRTKEPIKFISYSHGQPCIVIENRDTFHSFCRANDKAKIYSIIAYGCGRSFTSTWDDLQNVCSEYGCPFIEYFGDVDKEGIKIPFEVSAKIEIPFRLAERYYQAMLETVDENRIQKAETWEDVSNYASFFPKRVREQLIHLFQQGGKIPQEALPYPNILKILQNGHEHEPVQEVGVPHK